MDFDASAGDGLEEISFDLHKRKKMFAAYKEDLGAYINTLKNTDEDPFTRKVNKRYLLNKLIEKWYPALGFDGSVIKADIAELQMPPRKYKDSYNIAEILESYNPENNWLIPDLFRSAGLYIVAGEPKVGKSIFGYHLAYAVSISKQFLGRPVRGGRVLYLQLEEDSSTIAERTHFVGFGDMNNEQNAMRILSDPDCVTFDRTFDANIDIPKLHNRIAQLSPVMVIIDSLRAATITSTASEKDSEFGKIVAAIQQVFNQTDTCGVLIHHMNKEANKKGNKGGSLVNAISGSTAIASNSSGIIGLYAADEQSYSTGDGSKTITLRTLPRNGVPLTVEYTQTIDDMGIWSLKVQGELKVGNTALTAKIVRFLAANYNEFFTPATLANKLGVVLDLVFKQSLAHLLSNQTIIYQSDGVVTKYSFPESSLWMLSNTDSAGSRPANFSPSVIDAHAIMQCRTKRALYDATLSWDGERRKAAKQALISKEEGARLSLLTTQHLYDVGDPVEVGSELCEVVARLGTASLRDTAYSVNVGGELMTLNEWELTPVQKGEQNYE